jgi:hypothetical protein
MCSLYIQDLGMAGSRCPQPRWVQVLQCDSKTLEAANTGLKIPKRESNNPYG